MVFRNRPGCRCADEQQRDQPGRDTISRRGTCPAAPVVHPAPGKDSPLADAVQRRDKQAVLSLLKKHADVNAPQGDGATALHWAAYLEDAETTALLIRAGAKVNAPNNYGVTPLALAAGTATPRIIDQLVKAGADPNAPCCRERRETPLMHRGAHRTGRRGEGARSSRRRTSTRRRPGTDRRR